MSLPPATGAVELSSFKHHILRLLAQGKRLDERAFNCMRTPHVLHDALPGMKKNGLLASTLYTDDTGTSIACSVRGVFGPPPSRSPGDGRLTVDVTAPFLPGHGAGQTEAALHGVARFVRATIVSCLDLSRLCVVDGEACWVLHVVVTVMNADGGLRAAALHAAVAALHNMVLPKARLPSGDVVESIHLRFHSVPVATTIGICAAAGGGMHFLVDTNAAEESVADGLVTVVVDEKDGIVTLLHQGRFPLLVSRLTDAIEMFASHAATLRSAICNSGGFPINEAEKKR